MAFFFRGTAVCVVVYALTNYCCFVKYLCLGSLFYYDCHGLRRRFNLWFMGEQWQNVILSLLSLIVEMMFLSKFFGRDVLHGVNKIKDELRVRVQYR